MFKLKSKLIVAVMVMFGITAFMSCEKSNIETKNEFVNPKDEIGKMHNIQLQYVLENTKVIPDKNKVISHVEEILSQHNTLKSTVSLSSIPGFPENFDDLDMNNWVNEFNISSNLKSEIFITFQIFQNASDLNDIIQQIEDRESNASSLFSGNELDLFYEHLAVAKYTATFWYPEEQGGINGIQYLNVSNLKSTSSLKSTKAVNWWKVLGVDCVGGMMGGPVGYAGASAIAVIMQL